MPQLSTDAETAVEQLITLLIQQKRALETHELQIQQLADRKTTVVLNPFIEQLAKAKDVTQKLTKRVDELERIDSAFDDELKAFADELKHGRALAASFGVRLTQQAEMITKLQNDLVLFWRMTFLERLAWLLGGARLFKRSAALLVWWRKPWRH